MSTTRRVAGTLALSVLFLASCGSDGPVAVPTSTTTSAPSVPTSEVTPTSTTAAIPPTTTAFPGTIIEARYEGGSVTGVEDRVGVSVGETVKVRVDSDVAEEVHVHGYDLMVDLTPGEPAEITFTADIPGVFEVELENAGLELFQLQVS